MNISKIYLLMLGLSWFLSGCTTIPKQQEGLMNQLDGSLAQMQVDTKQLYQRLLRLTAEKSCLESNECKILAVGKRPCGGPEQFLVYSATSTDEKLLAITNDRYTKLKIQQQQRLGMQSTCQILPTPLPQCQARQCKILE